MEARVTRLPTPSTDLGVGRGDKVRLCSTTAGVHRHLLRLLLPGGVAVPVNIFYKEAQLEFLLRDSDSVALVATPPSRILLKIAEKPPLFKWLITTGPYEEGLLFRDLEERARVLLSNIAVGEDGGGDTLYLGYHGVPKGTCSPRAISSSTPTPHRSAGTRGDDRALMVPMFHGYA